MECSFLFLKPNSHLDGEGVRILVIIGFVGEGGEACVF